MQRAGLAQGSRGFGAPLGASEFEPSFQQFGSRKPPFRGPLEPQKGSQGPRGGSSETSEKGVRFQRSGRTRWATQRPLRGPVFPFSRGTQTIFTKIHENMREHD